MRLIDRSHALLAGLLLLLATGCGAPAEDTGTAAPSPEPEAPTQAMIDQGRSVFTGAGNCGVCHGSNAQGGNFGPDLTDGSWIWFDADSPTLWDDIAELIRSGVDDPEEYSAPMPAAGGGNLSDEQIRAVAAYVLSLN